MLSVSRRKIAIFSIVLVTNIIFFGFVSPLEGSSLLLFLGFGLLAVDVYLLLGLLTRLIQHLMAHTWRRPRILALAGTMIFIILLSLQSIGQLSIRDAIAVVVIGSIFIIYSSYYRKKR